MMRIFLSLVFVLSFVAVPALSHAQVCDPACVSPEYCVYSDSTNTKTECWDGQEVVIEGRTQTSGTFASIVNTVLVPIVDRGIIPLLYAFAFIFFLIGVARFFFSSSEESREKGKKFALWGIIGFVVLFSVWGIVKLLLSVIQQ